MLNALVESDGSLRQPPSSYAKLVREQAFEVPDSIGEVLYQLIIAKPIDKAYYSSFFQPNIRFYGPPGTFRTISVWDLFAKDRFNNLLISRELHNAVVFIGPTASVFQDRHNTAFAAGEGMPGVEIHATEFANLLDKSGLLLFKPGWLWAFLSSIQVALIGFALGKQKRPILRLFTALQLYFYWLYLIAF